MRKSQPGYHSVSQLSLAAHVVKDLQHERILVESASAYSSEVGIPSNLVSVDSEACHRAQLELLAGIVIDELVKGDHGILPLAYQVYGP